MSCLLVSSCATGADFFSGWGGGGPHCLVAGLVIIVSPEQILLSWWGVGGSHGLTSWLLT